jgi:hypothetical protein
MNSKRMLRISAILMLLHTAGHSIGASTWDQAPSQPISAILNGMKTEHFNFMGKSMTLAAVYSGYGYIMIGVLLLVTIVLWLLSQDPNRKLILVFGLFLLFLGIAELIWFFPFAAAFSLLASLLTLLALRRS